MKLRKSKGFTIIELVIVIAVIGILTAVLVPTFINLTNKANEAADQSLVKNLNTALKMEEQTAGHEKAQTLQGAIDDLEKQGFLLENIVSKSGQDLLWNQPNNEFVLNKEGEYSGKDYWQIVNSMPSTQKYSYYAGMRFSETEVTPKYGFDAGENTSITTVNYNGAGVPQKVAIRTNGGVLNINASSDTVNHYGDGHTLVIEAVNSSESYHEFGYFPKATIKQGRFVVEEKGQIQVLDVTGATAEVKVEQAGTGILNNIIKGDNTHVVIEEKLEEKVATVATKTTWAALKEEVENPSGVNVIKYEPTEDQTVTSNISIARNVTILGNGRLASGTIDGESVTGGIQYNGLINIAASNLTVCLDNLRLTNIKLDAHKNARAAINFCSSDCDVTISNSTLTGQYAICTNDANTSNNKLTLNSMQFGTNTYCSLYWRSSNGVINANYTKFSSVNTASNNQANGFGTIVIGFAEKAGFYDYTIDNKVENNILTLNKCQITKTELGDAVQCIVAVYSPYNNVVNLNDCDYDSKNNLIVLSKEQIWNTAATASTVLTTEYETDKPANASTLYVDGNLSDNALNVLHACTRRNCIPMIGGTTNCEFAEDGCDYLPLYGYQRVDNHNGTWTYRKA